MTTSEGVEMERTVNHLGGQMYGDGEYVIDFSVSEHSPLSATIMGPGAMVGVTYEKGVKPSIDVARRTIAMARAQA